MNVLVLYKYKTFFERHTKSIYIYTYIYIYIIYFVFTYIYTFKVRFIKESILLFYFMYIPQTSKYKFVLTVH